MRGRSLLENAIRGFRQIRGPCAGGGKIRRYIHISATPTIESPILSGDILSNSIHASTDSAGKRIFILSRCQIAYTASACRCPIRSSRLSIFSFVRFIICVSKVVYQERNVSWSQRKGRKCQYTRSCLVCGYVLIIYRLNQRCPYWSPFGEQLSGSRSYIKKFPRRAL
jgi:hypothetical protein